MYMHIYKLILVHIYTGCGPVKFRFDPIMLKLEPGPGPHVWVQFRFGLGLNTEK